MASVVDAFGAYLFVKHLAKPFEEWEAFKLGLIDKNGKRLRKAKSDPEKKSMSLFHNLVRNLKKVLQKLPFGKSKLASLGAALFLLREEHNVEYDRLISELNTVLPEMLSESYESTELECGYYALNENHILYNEFKNTTLILKEDKPFDTFNGIDFYKASDIYESKTFIISAELVDKVN